MNYVLIDHLLVIKFKKKMFLLSITMQDRYI